ncbi:hypothetical protein K3148_02200 [Qipengyuania aurantiaca]|uniref:Uncharacterized protein n=1 Tax=Qipengyuania aurantiaca TaxID=2867233 RepID=A0ABX8ZR57_9SPHN|nr:hypothetical protein [Qipengyuania aurantiaca]QZD90239.1 hypothetical protein K3148_02200 [Qipengyuania aurantiaca]
MSIDDSEGLDNPVAKWTVIATMTALVLVLAISAWLAFSVSLDMFARVEDDGQIHIRGSETQFVGFAKGTYSGHEVLIEGLPGTEQIQEFPLVWRALCVVRDDPRTDWSEANPMLKVHLHSEEMDETCRPFEGLEIEGSPRVPQHGAVQPNQ